MSKKKKKPTYVLKAETGKLRTYLQQKNPGAVVVSGQELMAMTKQLLTRLDRSTAWMMSVQASRQEQPENWAGIDVVQLQDMINANLVILDQFRKKEQEQ